MIEIFLRILTVAILIVWLMFWNFQAKKAEKEKLKTQKAGVGRYSRRLLVFVPYMLIIIQLFGATFFPFQDSTAQFIGFCILLIGVGISVISRLQLGANWTGAYDYQIKEKHLLITEGIYGYIRHPIYVSLILIYTGAEIVAQSYIAILMCLYLFIWSYFQARAEEKLLMKSFGKTYTSYMTRSKMFIPYIF